MHGNSNQDTHLYPLRNNSSVHLTTTTEERRSERNTDGMRSGWRTLRDSVLFIPDIGTQPPRINLRRTACFRLNRPPAVSDVSAPATQKGDNPFCGLRVWRRGSNHWPSCPSPTNPSTSLWSTWPDCSCWRDYRMTAQNLPRDLVQPSSELQQLPQTMMKGL